MTQTLFAPRGHHLIAGDWVAGRDTFLSAPLTGPSTAFARGTKAEVNRAGTAAEQAFWS